MMLNPCVSRGHKFEDADAHRHEDDQEGDRTKANSKTESAVKDESERAKSKTIKHHKKAAFTLCGPPNARYDRANSCREHKSTHKHNRALPRNSVSCMTEVHDRNDRLENATQNQ